MLENIKKLLGEFIVEKEDCQKIYDFVEAYPSYTNDVINNLNYHLSTTNDKIVLKLSKSHTNKLCFTLSKEHVNVKSTCPSTGSVIIHTRSVGKSKILVMSLPDNPQATKDLLKPKHHSTK